MLRIVQATGLHPRLGILTGTTPNHVWKTRRFADVLGSKIWARRY
jgi:hypothetical protein